MQERAARLSADRFSAEYDGANRHNPSGIPLNVTHVMGVAAAAVRAMLPP